MAAHDRTIQDELFHLALTSDDDWVTARAGRGRCAITARPLPAGTVVQRFSESAYAAVPLPSERNRVCTRCLRQEAKLLRCGKCKWARYCSGACQKADWPAHKHECAVLAAGSLNGLDDAPAADVLLAGRCLWRRHDAQQKQQSSTQSQQRAPAEDADVGADDAAFDGLEAGVASETDRALGRFAASLKGLLPPYSCDAEAAATATAAVSAFGRNNFGVMNELLTVVGAGCYPAAALLNHSCAPNCVLAYDGAALEIRALRHIEAKEELTHSYVDLCLPRESRQHILRERYGFVCTCPRCSEDATKRADNDDHPTMAHADDARLVNEALVAPAAGRTTPQTARASKLAKSAQLLARAAAEEDETAERDMVLAAVRIRRELCDPLGACRYEAEGRALSVALASGEAWLKEARDCCRSAVAFLESVLTPIAPSHPLLALQRFTLCDLELACGDEAKALEAMTLCRDAMRVCYAARSALMIAAEQRLAAMASLGS